MKNCDFNLILFLFFASFVCGCNSENSRSEVEKVRNGILTGHEQTTIGKAFESVLGDVEWKYFETEKGMKVVESRGTPGVGLIPRVAFRRWCRDPQKVVVQFTLHVNSDSFDVAYCGIGDESISCDAFLDFAYAGDSKYVSLANICKQSFGEVVDSRDGHRYGTVKIGNREWMSENLNYASEKSFCQNNDSQKCAAYGRLYRWDAAMKACPSGWHLPSQEEFFDLINSVGGLDVAGKMLKSASGWTRGWDGNGRNGTDEFWFAALPAGGVRLDEGACAYFWSSTTHDEHDEKEARYMTLVWNRDDIPTGYFNDLLHDDKYIPYSVRCIKDFNPETDCSEPGCCDAKGKWICE